MINYLKIKPEVTKPVKRIPDPLLFPFSVFMDNGGYKISPMKEGFIFKKGKNIAKIKLSLEIPAECYEMNEHCIQRFKTFTELYLKSGPKFIEDLDRQGSNRIPPAVKKILFGAAS